eukprot:6657405-Prymnesium_polylepis.1
MWDVPIVVGVIGGGWFFKAFTSLLEAINVFIQSFLIWVIAKNLTVRPANFTLTLVPQRAVRITTRKPSLPRLLSLLTCTRPCRAAGRK